MPSLWRGLELASAIVLPGGLIVLAAVALFRCRHRREIWRRRTVVTRWRIVGRDGVPTTAELRRGEVLGLECWRCGRWREATALLPDATIPGPRLTAPAVRCGDPIAELQRAERLARAAERVRARYGG